MSVLRFGASIAVCAITATALRAQCPDGTPPPCAPVRVAAAHRVDPPLDDHTWIVVPFTNVTHAADVDWLSDGSVSLLSIDLSHWEDIHVVDAGRVADLTRLVPEGQVRPLSLATAMAIARRAGARMLVTGSVIKQGSRTTVVAKVFDVSRGSAVRSAQENLAGQDSLMTIFGRLAEHVLNVNAPRGVDIANVGTSRVDAYREYVAGTKALNRFEFVSARAHLEQALRLDSTFALAHYKLAILALWTPRDTSVRSGAHAAAAARLSALLPARERALIDGYNAFAHGQYVSACETYGALVKSDSSDADAQYGLGECMFQDRDVLILSGGIGRAFRGSYNTALRAYQRALEADPTLYIAFPRILAILTNKSRIGFDRSCRPGVGPLACTYGAFIGRDHDTLLTVPELRGDAYFKQAADYAKSGATRRNLEQARAIATMWADAAPNENRAHGALGDIYNTLNDPLHAEEEFAMIRSDGDAGHDYIRGRAQALLKLGRTNQLRLIVDSALAWHDRAILLGPLTGRFALFDSIVTSTPRPVFLWNPYYSGAMTPYYYGAVMRAFVGGGDDVVARAEREYVDTLRAANRWSDTIGSDLGTLRAAPRMARAWTPTASRRGDRPGAIAVAVAHGDTALVRAELQWLDSVLASRPATAPDSNGASIILAEALLALHDSAKALRVVARALDSTWKHTDLFTVAGALDRATDWQLIFAWPRMALLRADLEAAVGSKAVAQVWYQRFLDLFSEADPEFEPMVTRARSGLAALGGRDVSPKSNNWMTRLRWRRSLPIAHE